MRDIGRSPRQKQKPKDGRRDLDSERRELSYAEASEMLFWSFYYSQGMPIFQNAILHYIAHSHPGWTIPSTEEFGSLPETEMPRYEKFLSSGSHKSVDDGSIHPQLKEYWSNFRRFVEEPKTTSYAERRESLHEIIASMIEIDSKYEVAGGRPIHFEHRRASEGPFRKHSSHFIEYIVKNKPAPGPAAYDQIFTEARADLDLISAWAPSKGFIIPYQKNGLRLNDLAKMLVDGYERDNPSEPLDLGKFPHFKEWVNSENTVIRRDLENKR